MQNEKLNPIKSALLNTVSIPLPPYLSRRHRNLIESAASCIAGEVA